MGLSIYNIKKWTKMLSGKSIMHVNQDIGKFFTPGKINGYFNNLTEKVLNDPDTLKAQIIPVTTDERAGEVYFPIAIFQYGLGAYDLYLETKEKKYYDQFIRCVDWAIERQEVSGAWDNFGFIQSDAPYSAMCQGEGCSLLLRAYKETKNMEFYNAAKKAIDYMLCPLEKGGTTEYKENEVYFYEYTNKPCVLNGWIFALFGLYDLSLCCQDDIYSDSLKMTLNTLKKSLKKYDNGYWSMYDDDGLITSPFYHKLHIAQLEALSLIDNDEVFEFYKEKFEKYQKNKLNKTRAFIYKAFQKIIEK